MISYPQIAVKTQMKPSPNNWNTSPKKPVIENLKGFLTIIWKTSHAAGQKLFDVIPIFFSIKN